ncbi:MAG: hypothetical protein A4S16_06605 [Proteobacteria bacterium SG_bin6]|nr:MAG: hypothetical protein A4S16_06605 [Proteobacteria bacterium SG_bin6]
MILALLLQTAMPPMPAWDMMPPLRLREERHVSAESSQFVAGEYAQGHCARPGAMPHLSLDVALLIDHDGTVAASVPRAIDCPTVEQFAAGLATGWARGNLARRARRIGWYRLRLDFDWTG